MIDYYNEFYKLKNKFLARVKQNFSLEKLSKVLDKFYELSFEEFHIELEKLTKQKLSLKEQDEWEDYFIQYKKEVLVLNDKIDKTDREINDLVYDLYGITNGEQKTIEESLNI